MSPIKASPGAVISPSRIPAPIARAPGKPAVAPRPPTAPRPPATMSTRVSGRRRAGGPRIRERRASSRT